MDDKPSPTPPKPSSGDPLVEDRPLSFTIKVMCGVMIAAAVGAGLYILYGLTPTDPPPPVCHSTIHVDGPLIIYHDGEHAVTCWRADGEPGISCIPDAQLYRSKP